MNVLSGGPELLKGEFRDARQVEAARYSLCEAFPQGVWVGEGKLWPCGMIGRWPFSRTTFRFEQSANHPLTFHAPDRRWYRPESMDETDMGSVPRWLWTFYHPFSFPMSFILHDSGYQRRALWVSDDAVIFVDTPMERGTVDDLLCRGVLAERGTRWDARVIGWAVRRFGGPTWRDDG